MRMFFGVLMLVVVLAIVGKLGKTQFESLGSVATRVRSISPPAPDGQESNNAGPRDSSIVAVPGGMPGAAPAGVEGTVGYQAKQVQDDFVKATNRALQSGGPDRIKRAEP
jgi:hypothetical protein